MSDITVKYKSTQGELYSITELALQNLRDDRTLFAAKKAKYTDAFIDAIALRRTNAMAMPDVETRNAGHQTLENLLPGLMDACKDKFSDLKGYIRDGWPLEDPKPRYESAGMKLM